MRKLLIAFCVTADPDQSEAGPRRRTPASAGRLAVTVTDQTGGVISLRHRDGDLHRGGRRASNRYRC
jgi:hypothetical protein